MVAQGHIALPPTKDVGEVEGRALLLALALTPTGSHLRIHTDREDFAQQWRYGQNDRWRILEALRTTSELLEIQVEIRKVPRKEVETAHQKASQAHQIRTRQHALGENLVRVLEEIPERYRKAVIQLVEVFLRTGQEDSRFMIGAMTRIIRGVLMHAPSSPFHGPGLEAFSDGGLAIQEGRIVAAGAFVEVRGQYPDAEVSDLREGVILPGFVDLHVHYPQARIIGALGYRLLDWLEDHTLPEEARLADVTYARALAKDFLRGLLKNGTTTALVFGSHFAAAMEVFFEEALASGLRILAGLVLSDRNLRPELHTTSSGLTRKACPSLGNGTSGASCVTWSPRVFPCRVRRRSSRSARRFCRSTPTCTSPPTSTRTSRRFAP